MHAGMYVTPFSSGSFVHLVKGLTTPKEQQRRSLQEHECVCMNGWRRQATGKMQQCRDVKLYKPCGQSRTAKNKNFLIVSMQGRKVFGRQVAKRSDN